MVNGNVKIIVTINYYLYFLTVSNYCLRSLNKKSLPHPNLRPPESPCKKYKPMHRFI